MIGVGCPSNSAPSILQLRDGSSARAVQMPIKMPLWRERRWCVSCFVRGPESFVCMPGVRDMEESSDWAYVRVTKGRSIYIGKVGRYGSRKEVEKTGLGIVGQASAAGSLLAMVL